MEHNYYYIHYVVWKSHYSYHHHSFIHIFIDHKSVNYCLINTLRLELLTVMDVPLSDWSILYDAKMDTMVSLGRMVSRLRSVFCVRKQSCLVLADLTTGTTPSESRDQWP